MTTTTKIIKTIKLNPDKKMEQKKSKKHRIFKLTSKTFKKNDYNSGDGMLTPVWGPSMWHFLHTMSFNYPVEPTAEQKKNYRDFVLNLRNVLPCKYCRMNLRNNLKAHPLKACHMKNRDTFSRFIYDLHETVNKMLGKSSGLSYCDVRERYEHFRSRCTLDQPKIFDFSKSVVGKTMKHKKEKGCTEPLYGKKAKCVIKIVPQEEKTPTFQVDDKCIKRPAKETEAVKAELQRAKELLEKETLEKELLEKEKQPK
jgi:Erv1 / Alr family